jgi:hypothetical protein
MAYTKSLDDCAQYFKDLLTTNQVALGINHVVYGNQTAILNFPVVIVEPVNAPKIRHNTQNIFLRTFRIYVWIAHSKMSDTRSARTKENILMAEAITAVMESDFTAGGRVVDGFVVNEEPVFGVVAAPTNTMVVGTRLTWEGDSVR